MAVFCANPAFGYEEAFGVDCFYDAHTVPGNVVACSSSGDESVAVDAMSTTLNTASSSVSPEALEIFYQPESEQEVSPEVPEPTSPPTQCRICGEPTTCCHYDVPSCSGCKTFFRRSVVSMKVYACRNRELCDIKGGDRCRACRFKRCVQAGMNPAAIKFPDGTDLAAVARFVEKHKRPASDDGALAVVAKTTPVFTQSLDSREVDFLSYLELKFQRLRESSFDPKEMYDFDLATLLARTTLLGESDKYAKPAAWPFSDDYFRALFGRTRERPCPPQAPNHKHWLVVDLILIIEVAKILPIFSQLCDQDKEALLKKAALINNILMSAYYSFMNHQDTIFLPDGSKPININKFRHQHRFVETTKLEEEVFCRSLEPVKRLALSQEEYVLLKAIVYTNPGVEDLTEAGRNLLINECDRYSGILLRRMQAVHGNAAGAVRFSQALAIIEAMSHFAQRNREFHVLCELKLAKKCLKKRRFPVRHRLLGEIMNA